MKYRKLRIAWSVACGVGCLLLVVLWVRSYWWQNWFQSVFSNSWSINCVSASGVVQWDYGPEPFSFEKGWFFENSRIAERSEAGFIEHQGEGIMVGISIPEPGMRFHGDWVQIGIPYWILLVLTGALGACAWIRFSLRALLIAMTLLIVGLGWAVSALRE
jgi:hypothetical protein